MGAKRLQLADGFSIPVDAVTQTFGILAVRGAGKSNAAAVMAEEMFAAHLSFVVVDPVGSWWGLRSSGDGKGPGLPVPIFGGSHGDVPLERTGGQVLADLVVDERPSCVLDLSELSEGDKIRFLIDFAERLYRRNHDPLHLFLEEADDYIPQRPFREQARLLRAFENIVRRGRGRGLGITMITQRSAAIAKSVLTQIETLLVLRTTSPQDRKAVEAWVDYHGQGRELLESLPSLENGEAWVWSPHWLKRFERVRIRRRSTFDSGATPKDVRARRPPATLADVDLAAVQERMAATIERAKAEDPRELRKQLAEERRAREAAEGFLESLKRQAAARPAKERRVEVPVVRPAEVKRLEAVVARAGAIGLQLGKVSAELCVALARAMGAPVAGHLVDFPAYAAARLPAPATARAAVPRQAPRAAAAPARRERAAGAATDDERPLAERPMGRAFLTALAQRPAGLAKGRLLVVTGYRSSGPVSSMFAALVREGLVEAAGGGLRITAYGIESLGAFEPLPVGAALREQIRRDASQMERAMLEALFAAYPGGITKGAILEKTGYASSGPVSSAFAKLVAIGYAVKGGRSELRASDDLFEGGR